MIGPPAREGQSWPSGLRPRAMTVRTSNGLVSDSSSTRLITDPDSQPRVTPWFCLGYTESETRCTRGVPPLSVPDQLYIRYDEAEAGPRPSHAWPRPDRPRPVMTWTGLGRLRLASTRPVPDQTEYETESRPESRRGRVLGLGLWPRPRTLIYLFTSYLELTSV